MLTIVDILVDNGILSCLVQLLTNAKLDQETDNIVNQALVCLENITWYTNKKYIDQIVASQDSINI